MCAWGWGGVEDRCGGLGCRLTHAAAASRLELSCRPKEWGALGGGDGNVGVQRATNVLKDGLNEGMWEANGWVRKTGVAVNRGGIHEMGCVLLG